MSAPIGLAQLLAHGAPDLVARLSPLERYVLANRADLWLRPDQVLPRAGWRTAFFQAGRGWGKTRGIGVYLNECVRSGLVSADPDRGIMLMAPTEARTEEVQIATLISTAPAWFKPERYAGGLVWPNGTRAHAFTPNAAGRTRGGNFELAWFTEVVDYAESHRWLAFTTATSATRRGLAQVLVDSTAMGVNEIIEYLHAEHARDPKHNLLIRGAMFDNPILTAVYLRSEAGKYVGQRLREELFGENFTQAAGARFDSRTIEKYRVHVAPTLSRTLVTVDPAQSASATSDETGIHAAGQVGEHIYALEDASGRMRPEQWGAKAVELALRWRSVGVFVERNKLGDGASYPIEVAARAAGLTVRVLDRHAEFPPAQTAGVLYIKCAQTGETKLGRAEGPAALMSRGLLHHVGVHAELERELTTFAGSGESPNRYDAYVYAANELAGLGRETPADGAAAVNAAADMTRELARRAADAPAENVAAVVPSLAWSARVGL